jgi:hypothetical protein
MKIASMLGNPNANPWASAKYKAKASSSPNTSQRHHHHIYFISVASTIYKHY